jgi:hypothetical protein
MLETRIGTALSEVRRAVVTMDYACTRDMRRIIHGVAFLPGSARALSTIMDIPQMFLPLFVR